MPNTERRKLQRIASRLETQLPAEIRVSHNHSFSAKVINLSRQGALLELNHPHSCQIRVDDRISVKLRLAHDVVWVAGNVRHAYGSRLGVFFPAGLGAIVNQSQRVTSKATRPVMTRRASQQILQPL